MIQATMGWHYVKYLHEKRVELERLSDRHLVVVVVIIVVVIINDHFPEPDGG